MIEPEHSLKAKLMGLREGEVLTVSTRDLANYHNGGEIRIPNGRPNQDHSPYHCLESRAQCAAIVRAYKELRLLLLRPPPGIIAEELPGSQFRVRFVRIENGGRP